LLGSRTSLWGWALLLGSRTGLWGWPLRLLHWMRLWSRPFLGRRPYRLRRSFLRHGPLCRRRLVDRPGLGPLLCDRDRLTPFHGKRPRHNDGLRPAAVYGGELGAVGAGGNPILLLNR